jgi:hypothetical protein
MILIQNNDETNRAHGIAMYVRLARKTVSLSARQPDRKYRNTPIAPLL